MSDGVAGGIGALGDGFVAELEEAVEIALLYEGPLTSGASTHHGRVKHQIRSAFHSQLKTFFDSQYQLRALTLAELPKVTIRGSRVEAASIAPGTHYAVPMRGFQFIPLVTRASGWIAQIHINLYRREDPGAIVHGGDLGARLETLFGALRIPQKDSEIPADEEPGDNPRRYCLLEDVALITKAAVETHTLLVPVGDRERETDVRLVLHVDIAPRRLYGGRDDRG